MIFQIPIDLKIDRRKVQAIIDLDTGVIGFTEEIATETIEYYFNESPIEFRKQLIQILEPMYADKSLSNFKVSGKNKNMRFFEKYLNEQKEKADNK
jgi:hypothetical protein